MIEYLGHELIEHKLKSHTYICNKCGAFIWASLNQNDKDKYLIKLGIAQWSSKITCDEMIIKGIIE